MTEQRHTKGTPKRKAIVSIAALALVAGIGTSIGIQQVSGSWASTSDIAGTSVSSGDLQIVKHGTDSYDFTEYDPNTNERFGFGIWYKFDREIPSGPVTSSPFWLSDFTTVREGDRLATGVVPNVHLAKHTNTTLVSSSAVESFIIKVKDRFDHAISYQYGTDSISADGLVGAWAVDMSKITIDENDMVDPAQLSDPAVWKFMRWNNETQDFVEEKALMPPKGVHEYTMIFSPIDEPYNAGFDEYGKRYEIGTVNLVHRQVLEGAGA